METTALQQRVDTSDLELKIKSMYRDVALYPEGEYHFEMGRQLAEKLGYNTNDLNNIPPASIDSFAGVGYFFDLAGIKPGDKVLDLGSGSGMDAFIAALKTGRTGYVTGIDMTDAQLDKANGLVEDFNLDNITFVKGKIEQLDFDDAAFDVVISNGVINLCPDKEKVFSEIARVLKPATGRLAIADIVSERQLPENIVCNSTLWASCIGGAAQEDNYKEIIEKPGLQVTNVKQNTAYAFISKSALGASEKYGVKSISLLAKRI
jgi:arsenite methyltransferase